MTQIEYPLAIRMLSGNEGGGYLIEFPDLPGCMSDGEAIANGRDAQELRQMAGAHAQIVAPLLNRSRAARGRQP